MSMSLTLSNAEDARAAKKRKARVANPCDGCTIRRVRCEAERPCHECRKRGIPCTNLRTRQKRGPKGPRTETARRVLEFQQRYAEERSPHAEGADEPIGVAEDDQLEERAYAGDGKEIDTPSSGTLTRSVRSLSSLRDHHLPMESYSTYLELFRDRLQCVWPVIDYDGLLDKLVNDENDYESHAFAASVCAATLAHLRLPENFSEQKRLLAERFAQDARSFRNHFDHFETLSMPSMLTSYFLHMYYVNSGKLRTAGFFMRETITYLQAMKLDRTETYDKLEAKDRAWKLRAYWLVLITERTYCAQNRVPIILPTIDKQPPLDIDVGIRPDILEAFGSLVKLFGCLRANITEVATVLSEEVFDMKRLMRYQADLAVDPSLPTYGETQCIDIVVTRQWIRLLIWEYTVRHFPLPYHADVPGFSLTFPVPVARELIASLSSAQTDSIICHGYSLELKVFRVADLLLDILSLSSLWRSHDNMLIGAEDVVKSLSNVLHYVGGPMSPFAKQTQMRLGELAVAQGSLVRPQLLLEEDQCADDEDKEKRQKGSEWIFDAIADL